MIKGIHVDFTDLTLNSGYQANIEIPYEDGSLGLIDIADPEFDPVLEASLMPFIYDPPTGDWLPATNGVFGGTFTLDLVANRLATQLPTETLLRYVNSDDPTTFTLFLSIGAQVVPEPSITTVLALGAVLLIASGREWKRKRLGS